jgi:hypothetical protein
VVAVAVPLVGTYWAVAVTARAATMGMMEKCIVMVWRCLSKDVWLMGWGSGVDLVGDLMRCLLDSGLPQRTSAALICFAPLRDYSNLLPAASSHHKVRIHKPTYTGRKQSTSQPSSPALQCPWTHQIRRQPVARSESRVTQPTETAWLSNRC